MLRPIAIATAISGALDILFAMILTAWFGREIPKMLRTVASGPFPAATDMGASGAILGLVVHFALMAIMATIFMMVVRLSAAAARHARPDGPRLRNPHLFRDEAGWSCRCASARRCRPRRSPSPPSCSPTSCWSASPWP